MKAGTRLRSGVCTATVVVVRAPASPVSVECGGQPMAEGAGPAGEAELAPGYDGGALLGKRYEDPASGLELLCTKGGAGSLSVDGRLLSVKDAKPLPASD
jgi:hypothetical protein